jgi:hypothetical protein
MGGRLLKLFLKSTRRRLRRAGSKELESIPESEGALTGLPERMSDHGTNGVLQPQPEGGQHGACDEIQAPNELNCRNEFLAADAAPVSSDDTKGGKA